MPRIYAHSILEVAFITGTWWLLLVLLVLCAYAVPYALEIVLWGVLWDVLYSTSFTGPWGMSIWGTVIALLALLVARFLADEVRLLS